MKSSDIRALTVEELRQKELDLRKELFNLRFRIVTGEVENPMRIKGLRKDIARVLTISTGKARAQK